ncbi:MAG: hypothetical protein Q9182_004538 [Xanthomendoza sp. 2 TL-2023]
MDIVEAWLAATIQQDLDRVIQTASVQPASSVNGDYEDDGSNLRVKASKPGVVQIIKWEKYDETFTAWISDSRVRMKAIFASTAAIQHEKKTGTRITEDTVGNIIQLEDAEIVASHIHGIPRTSRITFRIRKFKVIGADTSGQIGDPRPFDATFEFDELLRKLATFRGAGETSSRASSTHGTPKKTSPVGPQLGHFAPVNPDRVGSQQLFSQVPIHFSPSDSMEMVGQKNSIELRVPRNPIAKHNPSTNRKPTLIELVKAKNAPKSKSKALGNRPPISITKSPDSSASSAYVEQNGLPPRNEAVALARPRTHGTADDSPGSLKTGFHEAASRKVKSKRISSREIRIPKDQQELLDREDSWLPAKPGSRGPVAHVPPTILEGFNRRREASAAEKSLSECSGTPKGLPICTVENLFQGESDETAVLEPEVLISREDWPSSCPVAEPRCDLPPDSSPFVTNDIDLDNRMTVQHDNDPPTEDAGYDSDAASLSQREAETSSSISRHDHAKIAQSWMVPEPARASNEHESTNSPNERMDKDSLSGVSAETNTATLDSRLDLEMSVVPPEFGQQAEPFSELLSTQEVPATAIQPQEPFLQVKRTPYGVGTKDELSVTDTGSYPSSERFSSPSKRRRMNDTGRAHRTEGSNDDSQPADLHEIQVSGQSPQLQSSSIYDTVLAPIPSQPEILHPNEDRQQVLAPPAGAAEHAENIADGEEKLGFGNEQPILSPHVSKRRKLHKVSTNFGFSQDEYPKEDPSITARRDREEFMARRKILHAAPSTSSYDFKPLENRQNSPYVLQAAISPSPTLDHGASYPHAWSKHPVDVALEVSDAHHKDLDGTRSGSRYHDTAGLAGGASAIPPVNSTVSINVNEPASQQSGQEQSLPELMTPAMSFSELPQGTAPPLDLATTSQESSFGTVIYLRFQSAYPEYLGSKAHFIGMCKKIDQLYQADRMEHKSLWDDYIVRHRIEYPKYLERCLENAEDPKTYERFYREEVDEPRYTRRIILPSTLSEAFPVAYPSLDSRKNGLTAGIEKVGSPSPTKPSKKSGIGRSAAGARLVDLLAPESPRDIPLNESGRATSKAAKDRVEPAAVATGPISSEPDHQQDGPDSEDKEREKDRSSLKSFIKSYSAIKPGKHNAWAQEMVVGKARDENPEVELSKVDTARQIDMENWRL